MESDIIQNSNKEEQDNLNEYENGNKTNEQTNQLASTDLIRKITVNTAEENCNIIKRKLNKVFQTIDKYDLMFWREISNLKISLGKVFDEINKIKATATFQSEIQRQQSIKTNVWSKIKIDIRKKPNTPDHHSKLHLTRHKSSDLDYNTLQRSHQKPKGMSMDIADSYNNYKSKGEKSFKEKQKREKEEKLQEARAIKEKHKKEMEDRLKKEKILKAKEKKENEQKAKKDKEDKVKKEKEEKERRAAERREKLNIDKIEKEMYLKSKRLKAQMILEEKAKEQQIKEKYEKVG